MNQNIKTVFLLPLDAFSDLLSDKGFVIFSGHSAGTVLGAYRLDLLGLRERADSGGREQRKSEFFLLDLSTFLTGWLTNVVICGNGSHSGGYSRICSTAFFCKQSAVGGESRIIFKSIKRCKSAEICQFNQFFLSKCQVFQVFSTKSGFMFNSIRNMQKRAGGGNYSVDPLCCKFLQNFQSSGVVVSPDILTVNQTGKQDLILRETVFFNQAQGLSSFDKIKTDTGKRKFNQFRIDITHVTEIGLQEDLCILCSTEQSSVDLTEQGNLICAEILYQRRFIELQCFNTAGTGFFNQFTVGSNKFVNE